LWTIYLLSELPPPAAHCRDIYRATARSPAPCHLRSRHLADELGTEPYGCWFS